MQRDFLMMTRRVGLLLLLASATRADVESSWRTQRQQPLQPLQQRSTSVSRRHSPAGSGGSVVLAARKLCLTPGLLAAAGGLNSSLMQRHIRGFVFGGMDGILTTFALLAAAEGSQHSSSSLTLVIGLSTVLADALSMAAGEYLSAKAEDDISGTSADEPPPLEKAIAMFVAFTSFGCMPLMAYIVSALIAHHSGIAADPRASFLLSTGISGLSLFALGAIKSRFGDTGDWLKSGLEVTGVGGCAATVAFFTAKLIDQHLG